MSNSLSDVVRLLYRKIKFEKRIQISECEGVLGVVFMNPTMFIAMVLNPSIREIILSLDTFYCDSTLLKWIFKYNSGLEVRRITGPEFFVNTCKSGGKSHALLGGSSSSALHSLAYNLGLSRDTLIIDLPFKEADEFDYIRIAEKVNRAKSDYIWIGIGAPKQELFIDRLRPLLNHNCRILGVGAAFDYFANRSELTRLQIIMSKLGLEWFYRLLKSPKRIGFRLLRILRYLPVMLLNCKYHGFNRVS